MTLLCLYLLTMNGKLLTNTLSLLTRTYTEGRSRS